MEKQERVRFRITEIDIDGYIKSCMKYSLYSQFHLDEDLVKQLIARQTTLLKNRLLLPLRSFKI